MPRRSNLSKSNEMSILEKELMAIYGVYALLSAFVWAGIGAKFISDSFNGRRVFIHCCTDDHNCAALSLIIPFVLGVMIAADVGVRAVMVLKAYKLYEHRKDMALRFETA